MIIIGIILLIRANILLAKLKIDYIIVNINALNKTKL